MLSEVRSHSNRISEVDDVLVFPEPRNPVMMVIGIMLAVAQCADCSSSNNANTKSPAQKVTSRLRTLQRAWGTLARVSP